MNDYETRKKLGNRQDEASIVYMFKKNALLLLLVLLCPSPPCRAASRDNLLETLTRNREATVTVRAFEFVLPAEAERSPLIQKIATRQNTGAGVIISPDGTVVTNTHIIFGSQRTSVILHNGEELPARIIFISRSYDFSLLRISPSHSLGSAPLGDSDSLRLGSPISTIGHSDLLNGTISGGVVAGIGSRPTPSGDSIELIQLNINHYPGDSGGPVFDRDGRLVGLMSSKRLTKDRACLAVPVNKIMSAYNSLDNPVKKK